jgi:hypothetical protein
MTVIVFWRRLEGTDQNRTNKLDRSYLEYSTTSLGLPSIFHGAWSRTERRLLLLKESSVFLPDPLSQQLLLRKGTWHGAQPAESQPLCCRALVLYNSILLTPCRRENRKGNEIGVSKAEASLDQYLHPFSLGIQFVEVRWWIRPPPVYVALNLVEREKKSFERRRFHISYL